MGTASVTEVFDERTVSIGETATFNIEAGSVLGWYLISNDTLQRVFESSDSYINGGNQSVPLFSVSEANPGSYDHLMTFGSGNDPLPTFDVLARTGRSEEDFTDLVVKLEKPVLVAESVETVVPQPPDATFIVLACAGLIPASRRRR